MLLLSILIFIVNHLAHKFLQLSIEFSSLLNSFVILCLWDQFGLILNENHHLIANFGHHIVHKPVGSILQLRVSVENFNVPSSVLINILEIVISSFDIEADMAVGSLWDRVAKI